MQVFVNKSLTRKALNYCLLIAFGLNLVFPGPVLGQALFLPPAGVLAPHSPVYAPVLMLGVQTYPDQPLRFDFIMDAGDSGLTGGAFQAEADKLIRYFLASLTVPEEEMWVNLSPVEKDRIIPDKFGQTRMGRDLLAQDYLLKQVTASMIYPEQELGRAFWQRIYARAKQEYGVSQVPVDTFNKVWIVPERADVYVNGAAAFVTGARLKVMLAADYLARGGTEGAGATAPKDPADNAVTAQIVREVIIPELEQEVNEGERFAGLRQVFWSHILATWYKRNLTQALVNQHYSDRNAVTGIADADPAEQQQIYQQYLQTFQDGIFNYIREDQDPATGTVVPRKYFAGGVQFVLGKDALRVSGMSSPVVDDWSRRAGRGDTGLIRMVRSQFRPGAELTDPAPVSSPAGDGDAAVAEAASLSPSRARWLNIDDAWAQIREILAGEKLGPRGGRTDAHKAAIRSVLKRVSREGDPGVFAKNKALDFLLRNHRLLEILPLLKDLLQWKTVNGQGYLFSGLQAAIIAISARVKKGESVPDLIGFLSRQDIHSGDRIVLFVRSIYSNSELQEIVPLLWKDWLPNQSRILAQVLGTEIPAEQLLARGRALREIVVANPEAVYDDDVMVEAMVAPERMAADLRRFLADSEAAGRPSAGAASGLEEFLRQLTADHRQAFARIFIDPEEARRLSAAVVRPAAPALGIFSGRRAVLAEELLADGRTPGQLTSFEYHLLDRLEDVYKILLPERAAVINYQRAPKLKQQLDAVLATIERDGQRLFAGEKTRTRDDLKKYKRLRQDLPLLARLLAWPDGKGGYLFTGPQAVSILTAFKLLPGEEKSAELIISAVNELYALGITSGANIANILLADKRGLVPELIEAGLPNEGVMIARIVRTSAPPAQVLYYSRLWGRVMRDNPLVKFPPRLVVRAIVFAKITGEALRRMDDQDGSERRGARVGENWFLLELRQVLAAVSPEDAQSIRQSYTGTEERFQSDAVTAADAPAIRQADVGIEKMFFPVAAFLADEPADLTIRDPAAQEELADLLARVYRPGDPRVLFGTSARQYLARYPRLWQALPLLIKLVQWRTVEGTYLLTGLQATEIVVGFKTAGGPEEKMREVVASIKDLLSRGVASGKNISNILRSANRDLVSELISAGLPVTGDMLGEVIRSVVPPAQVFFYGQVWGMVMQANTGVDFPAQVVAEAIEFPALAAETLLSFVTDQGQAQEGRVNGFGLGGGSAAGLRRVLAAVRSQDVRDLQQAYQNGLGRDWTSKPVAAGANGSRPTTRGPSVPAGPADTRTPADEGAVLTDPGPVIERMRAKKVARHERDLVLWNQILKDNPDAVLDEAWLETILAQPRQMARDLRRLAARLSGRPVTTPLVDPSRYLSMETFLRSATRGDILAVINHYLPADEAETLWSILFSEMLRDRRALQALQSAEMPQQWDRDWPRAAPYSLLPRLVHSYHEEFRSAARTYLVELLTTAQRDGSVVFDRETAEQLARHPRLGELWDRLPEALFSADPDNGGALPSGRKLYQWLESSASPADPVSGQAASSPVGGIDMQTTGMEWHERTGPVSSPGVVPAVPDAGFWNQLPEQGLTPRIIEIVPVTPAQIPQILGIGLLAGKN